MAGRPPKSHLQLITEGKSHRTKAELATREKAEKSLLTGTSMREWPDVKASPVAHKEFMRLRKLFKVIDKDDALHEGIINRYCLLLAESKEFDGLKERLVHDIEALTDHYAQGEMDFIDYIGAKGKLQDRLLAMDRKIMDKRAMMLQIEKENLLTIASALRAIPKKPADNKASPMADFLKRKAGGKDGP
jgi:hypothetical protein